MKNKFYIVIVIAFFNSILNSKAQNVEKSYADIANERAMKIVENLNIFDAAKEKKIRTIIAAQYVGLNKIHTNRDNKITKNANNKDKIIAQVNLKVFKLQKSFLNNLTMELEYEQIEEVKNGMTYHTVPLTFVNYQLMLPYLKKDELTEVYNYLVEGREQAMTLGSAKEKHAVFNKYKGKIANYLAQKGYDLKKEGNEWSDRRNLKATSLEIVETNKVMKALNLKDESQERFVRNLIAYQYQKIEEFTTIKKNKFEENKELSNKKLIETTNELAWKEYKSNLDTQRDVFFVKLIEFINLEQIEIVKNEMTANGLLKEYARFQELLPNLKEDDKKKVYQFLLEARENAVNVLTNRERNQWFIKYRGRANNYLSAQGYDLRKATEDLQKKQLQ